MSIDLSGNYETERGLTVEIKKSEHQFQAVFPSGPKHTLKLDGKSVLDVTTGLDGMLLDSGDIQFDNGCWWKKHEGPRFRFKYDDNITGRVFGLNRLGWSSLMTPTGLLASVTSRSANNDSTDFDRPLLVEEYENVLSKSPAKVERITDYDGLRKLLVSHENLAFQWGCKGYSWSDWMSKDEVCRDVWLRSPDLGKSRINIKVFKGIPSQWVLEDVENIGSAEAFKAALNVHPALKLTRVRTESASAVVVAARLAEEIYEDPKKIQAGRGEYSSVCFGVTEQECSSGSCIFVVFRGRDTDDDVMAFTDLKSNLSADKPWSNKIGICVNADMWENLRGTWIENSGIMSKLVKLWRSKKSKHLVLTGHSYGASLAMMLHAYIWILLRCKATDSPDTIHGYSQEFEEQGFRDFLRSARCYAFAGLTVFAESDSHGEGSWQNEFIAHMLRTTRNFMFREDLIPRAYSALDLEDAVTKMARQVAEKRLGRLATKLMTKLSSINSSVLNQHFSAYRRYACKYSHCCIVEVIGQRSLPWHIIHVGLESLHHHSMKTYRISIENREQGEGFFEEFPVSFGKQDRWSLEVDSELRKMAHDGEWDTVLRALEEKPESLDVFLREAALQHKRHAIIGLCRLGANLLSRPDGKSLVDISESNAEAQHPEEFCSWLGMILDVAENLHSAGTPLEDVAKKIAKEWVESENMHETFAEAMERFQKQVKAEQLEKHKLDIEDEEADHTPVKTTFALFGSPGCGKSTFGNGLLQTAAFQSGMSDGKGMTKKMQVSDKKGKEVVDGPGLSEPDSASRLEVARENTKSLKYVAGKPCQFLFFCSQRHGRVSEEDRGIIKLILEAAPQIGNSFGIILNECQKDVLRCQDDQQFRESFLKVLFAGLPAHTEHVYFHPYLDDWCEGNKIPQFSKRLQSFLDDIPAVTLTEADVSDVLPDSFDDLRRKLDELPQGFKEQLEEAHAIMQWQMKLSRLQATRNFWFAILLAPVLLVILLPAILAQLHVNGWDKATTFKIGKCVVNIELVPICYSAAYLGYRLLTTFKAFKNGPEAEDKDFSVMGYPFRPACLSTNVKIWHIWFLSQLADGILDTVTLRSLKSVASLGIVSLWCFTTLVALFIPFLYARGVLAFTRALLVKTIFEDTIQTTCTVLQLFSLISSGGTIDMQTIFSTAFAISGLVEWAAKLAAWQPANTNDALLAPLI